MRTLAPIMMISKMLTKNHSGVIRLRVVHREFKIVSTIVRNSYVRPTSAVSIPLHIHKVITMSSFNNVKLNKSVMFFFLLVVLSLWGTILEVQAVITDNVMNQFEVALQGDKNLPEVIRKCDVELFGTNCKIDAFMSRLSREMREIY